VQHSFSSISFDAFACPLHVSVYTKTIFRIVSMEVLLRNVINTYLNHILQISCTPRSLCCMQLYAPHCLLYAAVRPALFAVCSCPPRTVCCMQLYAPHCLLYAAVLPALFAVCNSPPRTVCCMQLYALHCLLYAAVLPALFGVCSCPPRTVCCMQLSAQHSLLYTAVLPNFLLYAAVRPANRAIQLLKFTTKELRDPN